MTGAEVAAVAAVGQAPVAQRAEVSAPASQSFATVLAQGIEGVNGALIRADAMLAQAALDGSQPPHQVMLALEEARLSFHLALQVRNRLLEGYQELLRMQV
jgi:flagellar hook-basal body complex protein FliE